MQPPPSKKLRDEIANLIADDPSTYAKIHEDMEAILDALDRRVKLRRILAAYAKKGIHVKDATMRAYVSKARAKRAGMHVQDRVETRMTQMGSASHDQSSTSVHSKKSVFWRPAAHLDDFRR